MKCPLCNVDLQMTDRQGVEIDYCPKCRGVWLDRGELDKLIERSMSQEGERGEQFYPNTGRGGHREDHREYDERRYPKKKKSFWREMFDFD